MPDTRMTTPTQTIPSISQQQMPPLSEKDLAYLKDHMSWELVAAKKAHQYAHQTQEPECRQVMFQIAQQHQQNVERLVQHLEQHVSQTLQSTMGQPATAISQI